MGYKYHKATRIPVNYETEQPTVSARDLHEALNIEKRFSAWFETNSQGFIKDEDFTSVLSGTVVNIIFHERRS